MFGVSVLTFLMIRLIPGDAVQIMLGANAEVTPQQIATMRARLGLDQSIFVQYAHWVGRALHGDLGTSVWTGRPVLEASYAAALAEGYLWHEFGDVHLILP